jgi:dihydroxy-acid dehydratase
VEDNKGFGSIAVLKGNIAPEGAVVKFSAVSPDMLIHEGPARVFDREEAALDAIMNGSIQPGSVIVLRYEGPRGSGMPEILATTEALVTNPKLQHTAIITDGRFSGATRGPCIGHVSPEAVAGGPIALVEDDDLLSIDIPARTLNIVGHADRRMDSDEVQSLLAERKKQWHPPKLRHPRGILRRYAGQVVSAIKGAYLE